MARAILHIGTHKTATTTLQDSFRLNAALLARRGLIYPQIDARHSGHHGLVTDWNPLPAVYHLPGGSMAALTLRRQWPPKKIVTPTAASRRESRAFRVPDPTAPRRSERNCRFD